MNLNCIKQSQNKTTKQVAPLVQKQHKKEIQKPITKALVKQKIPKAIKAVKKVAVKKIAQVQEKQVKEQQLQEKQFQEKKLRAVTAKVPEKSPTVLKTKTPQEEYMDDNLAKIVQLLQENIYYPRRARKLGIQGDVLVQFKLSKEGTVSNIEVVSSKHNMLSRAAVKTIENISNSFPKPKEDVTLNVPISYRLQ